MFHSCGIHPDRLLRGPIVFLLILVAAADNAATADGHAADPTWWSFQPLVQPPVPSISDRTRSHTAIDAFIEAKLEANGLAIGPEADRRTLLRRLKFDLHGLPPSPEELDEFTADQGPDAYERLVERLLDSRRYRERCERHRLDVVG